MLSIISPTSSRKSVPPFASSSNPCFCCRASVKGALLVAEQLGFQELPGDGGAVHLQHRLSRRPESSWIQCAMSSFPVPLSPSIRTLVESLCATCSTMV